MSGFLCILGWLLLLFWLVRGISLSWQYGKLYRWRAGILLQARIDAAYKQSDMDKVTELMGIMNVGKLFSPYQDIRETAIQQLRYLEPTPLACRALIVCLKREHSQSLQLQILDTLKILVDRWKDTMPF